MFGCGRLAPPSAHEICILECRGNPGFLCLAAVDSRLPALTKSATFYGFLCLAAVDSRLPALTLVKNMTLCSHGTSSPCLVQYVWCAGPHIVNILAVEAPQNAVLSRTGGTIPPHHQLSMTPYSWSSKEDIGYRIWDTGYRILHNILYPVSHIPYPISYILFL